MGRRSKNSPKREINKILDVFVNLLYSFYWVGSSGMEQQFAAYRIMKRQGTQSATWAYNTKIANGDFVQGRDIAIDCFPALAVD